MTLVDCFEGLIICNAGSQGDQEGAELLLLEIILADALDWFVVLSYLRLIDSFGELKRSVDGWFGVEELASWNDVSHA